MDALQIRRMRADDIPAVAALSGDLGYPEQEDRVGQRFRLIEATPHNAVWVAERDDQVLGWLHGHGGHLLEADSYVEIGGLVVAAFCRGQGIGKALLAACEAWAYQQGFPRIRLRSGRHRPEAHAFYRRLGYQERPNGLTFDLKLPRAKDKQ